MRSKVLPTSEAASLPTWSGIFEVLRTHPDLGRVVPEFDAPNLREIIHPPFRIIYRRDASRISVVRVWRGERVLKLP